MSATHQQKLSDSPGAEAALLDLCRPFAGADFVPECSVAQPDEIPFPQDQLLVHHAHMTEVLERHHGRPVEVHVQDYRLEGNIYTRKIALTPAGSNVPVEWGIVRMDFQYIDPPVRDEILARGKPLGAILIEHNVLRRIKMRWFMKFPEGGPVLRLFGRPVTPEPAGHAYGRIGTIYCNEEPAIELLEIVVNTSKRNGK